jgi:hypothetical protein
MEAFRHHRLWAFLSLLWLIIFILACEIPEPTAGPDASPPSSPTPRQGTEIPSPTIQVDTSLMPLINEAPELRDETPRIVASIADESGSQMDFVDNELLAFTDDQQILDDFLGRWEGEVLEIFDSKYHVVRVNPSLARIEELENGLRTITPASRSRYRVSSEKGIRLLAAAASEKVTEQLDVEVNWVTYGDPFVLETIEDFPFLKEVVAADCSHLLLEEMRLLIQVSRGGPEGQLAEEQLLEQIGDPSHCAPPIPTFDLLETEAEGGLVLPEVEGGEPVKLILLNPPTSIPAGFTAEIISAQGRFSPQPPLGGTLYGGRCVSKSPQMASKSASIPQKPLNYQVAPAQKPLLLD